MTEEETIRKCKTYVVKDVEARMEVEGDKCHNRKRRGRNDACVLLPYWSNGFCNGSLEKLALYYAIAGRPYVWELTHRSPRPFLWLIIVLRFQFSISHKDPSPDLPQTPPQSRLNPLLLQATVF